MAHGLDKLRSGVLPEDRRRWIARQGMDEQEEDDGQPEEDRDHAQQPSNDVSQHATGLPSP